MKSFQRVGEISLLPLVRECQFVDSCAGRHYTRAKCADTCDQESGQSILPLSLYLGLRVIPMPAIFKFFCVYLTTISPPSELKGGFFLHAKISK